MDIIKLEERLIKNREKLIKAYTTLERHKKQAEKKFNNILKLGGTVEGKTSRDYAGQGGSDLYWEFCDYEKKLEDIINTEKKIKETQAMIMDIETKIDLENNKDMFIQNTAPRVIIEFVENWKKLAHNWYVHRYNTYIKFKRELKEKERQARINIINTQECYVEYRDKVNDNYYLLNAHPRNVMDNELKKLKLDYKSIDKELKAFGADILRLEQLDGDRERADYLEKMLEEQKRALILDLLQRITSKSGEIVDANNLYLSSSGQINGYIIGKKATVKVETIGAGGYNIQCFHFRTLVNEVNTVG